MSKKQKAQEITLFSADCGDAIIVQTVLNHRFVSPCSRRDVRLSEVWVIVQDTSVVCGHGDTQLEPVLAYKGWDTAASHPAFTSAAAAKRYLDGLELGAGGALRAKRLELREG
jgi:hypothetical protein